MVSFPEKDTRLDGLNSLAYLQHLILLQMFHQIGWPCYSYFLHFCSTCIFHKMTTANLNNSHENFMLAPHFSCNFLNTFFYYSMQTCSGRRSKMKMLKIVHVLSIRVYNGLYALSASMQQAYLKIPCLSFSSAQ